MGGGRTTGLGVIDSAIHLAITGAIGNAVDCFAIERVQAIQELVETREPIAIEIRFFRGGRLAVGKERLINGNNIDKKRSPVLSKP